MNVTIDEPAELVLTEVLTSHQNVDCFGNATGALEVAASDGTAGYLYSLDGGVQQASGLFTNLSAGTYALEVEDNNGCLASMNVILTEPDALELTVQSQSDVTCFGGNNGAVVMEATGGTPNYTYQWSEGYGTQPNISNFEAGTFTLTVTDAYECEAIQSVTIEQPDEIVVSQIVTPVSCGNHAGSCEINVAGGTGTYTYQWDGLSCTDASVFGLTAGVYSVTATDSDGCTVQSSMQVPMEGNLSINISEDESISCFGDTNAALSAVSNGEIPLTYYWNNGGQTNCINNLGAGTYSVFVTDALGCSGSESHVVIEPNQIQVSFSSQGVSCYGGNDGIAIASATGGTPDYTYNWIGYNTGDTLLNVPQGSYQVEVTDSHACTLIDQVVINQPASMLNMHVDSRNITCYGANDGQIISGATGGTPPYAFEWSSNYGSVSGENLNNLGEGFYYLNLMDANGCDIDTSVMISQPAPIIVDYFKINPSCIGNSDGYIELEVEGGVEPYVYSWDIATSSLPYFDGLYEGSYEIIVQDANDCEVQLNTITLVDFPEECLRIPNAFTPNDDDNNDEWIIENLDLFNKYQVQVFNRWGQILYTGKPGSDPWNGRTIKGNLVPTGSYMYVVELFNGSKPKTGIVSVVY
jgi:gliding motility-associated-like protein